MNIITSNISTLYAEDTTAVLTLENGVKNLLTEPEFIEKDVLLDFLDKHPEVNSLVIRGKGRHFSHGADVSLFSEESTRGAITQKLEKARELLRTIERLPLLTAAAINGGCFGGGLEIALSCQFRIASPKAFLGLTEIMHGVVPGMGGMERMQSLLGREKAIQLCMNGEMLTAQQALDCGLITKISDEKDAFPECMNFVHSLAEGKTKLQIECILNTMNNALDGAEDPSKGQFEKVLEQINN